MVGVSTSTHLLSNAFIPLRSGFGNEARRFLVGFRIRLPVRQAIDRLCRDGRRIVLDILFLRVARFRRLDKLDFR